MTPKPRRAVIYARISSDPTGQASGVRRQIEACEELAESQGYEVLGVYQDNDISAMDSRKKRPQFELLMAAVARGDLDAVIVWQTSRLVRSRIERAKLIELFGKTETDIVPVQGPIMQLGTAYGRFLAELLTAADTIESDVKAERVAAASAQRAREGRPSSKIGFGWRKTANGTYEPEPAEAAVVARVVDDVRRNVSLRAICKSLNEEGVPRPRSGVAWQPATVRALVKRPSNVARRVHHVGRATEVVYEAVWPALVELEAWNEACAVLSSPDRFTRAQRGAPRKWLLTYGIGVCDVCAGPLRGKTMKDGPRYTRLTYQCDRLGCVSRSMTKVDELVTSMLFERLSRPDIVAGVHEELARRRAPDRDIAQEMAAVDAKLNEIARLSTSKGLSPSQVAIMSEELLHKRDQLERLLPLDTPTALAASFVRAGHIQTVWDGATVGERHALLKELGTRVAIMPSRGGRFNPSSVTVSFAF